MTAYQLDPAHPLPDEVARVLNAQVGAARAAAALGDAAEARACGARARALLRLVRSGLPSPARRLDQALTGLARVLPRPPEPALSLVDAQVREGLVFRSRGSHPHPRDRTTRALDALGPVGPETFEAVRWDHALAGFRRSWRDARAAMREAADDAEPDTLRGWRKATGRAAHHVQLVAGAWPEVLGAAAAEVGAVHASLAELEAILGLVDRLDRRASSPRALVALDASIRHRTKTLREHARARGALVFAMSPRTVVMALEDLIAARCPDRIEG